MVSFSGAGTALPIERGENLELVKGAEAIFYFEPGSYRLGRTYISPSEFLDDPMPVGAIPFALLSLNRVPGAIVGGHVFHWPVSDAPHGLLTRLGEEIDRDFRPALGHPRIKYVDIAPQALVYWHESSNRKMTPSHLAFPASEALQFDLTGGGSSFFYPVAIVPKFGMPLVFSPRYFREPDRFALNDPRRLRLVDFRNALESGLRKSDSVRSLLGERKIAAA